MSNQGDIHLNTTVIREDERPQSTEGLSLQHADGSRPVDGSWSKEPKVCQYMFWIIRTRSRLYIVESIPALASVNVGSGAAEIRRYCLDNTSRFCYTQKASNCRDENMRL